MDDGRGVKRRPRLGAKEEVGCPKEGVVQGGKVIMSNHHLHYPLLFP